MFGRRKQTDREAAGRGSATAPASPRPGAKNRPTPSRRQQEAANRRPLVTTDRRRARREQQLAARAARVNARKALLAGDEAHLPARDKGPQRRFIRDAVDSRWNIGEFLLPIMLVVLVLTFVRTTWAQLIVFFGVYGLIAAGFTDAFLMWRRIKKAMVARFGEEPARGSAMYAVMRAFQIRRSRLPKPKVERGAKVL